MELKVGHVTLYAQLARILRDQIYSGVLKNEQEIPTLNQMAAQYNVARITIRQAIQILSSEGLLSSQRGRRTVVKYRPPTETGPLYSSVGAVDNNPTALSINIVSRKRIDTLPVNLARQGVAAKSYMMIQKIDSERDIPYVCATSFVELPLFQRFPRGSEKRIKLFRLVRDYAAITPLTAKETIKISMPDPDEAEMLRIPSSMPVARLTRLIKDPHDTVLFYGIHIYRGDWFCIERDISSVLVKDTQSESSR